MYIPKRNADMCPQKVFSKNIHSHFLHNSQKWKQPKCPSLSEKRWISCDTFIPRSTVHLKYSTSLMHTRPGWSSTYSYLVCGSVSRCIGSRVQQPRMPALYSHLSPLGFSIDCLWVVFGWLMRSFWHFPLFGNPLPCPLTSWEALDTMVRVIHTHVGDLWATLSRKSPSSFSHWWSFPWLYLSSPLLTWEAENGEWPREKGSNGPFTCFWWQH